MDARRCRGTPALANAFSGRYRTPLLCPVLLLLLGSARAPAISPNLPPAELVVAAQSNAHRSGAIEAVLDTRVADLQQSGDIELASLVQQFYADRGFGVARLDGRARGTAFKLLVRITAADRDGLCPLRYDSRSLRHRLAAASKHDAGGSMAPAAAALDVDLTTAMLRYLAPAGQRTAAAPQPRPARRRQAVVAASTARSQPAFSTAPPPWRRGGSYLVDVIRFSTPKG